MATATGYTKAFMDTIVDATVVGAHVDTSGDLILETHDGGEINSGSIYPSAPVLVAALLDYFHPVGDIKMTVVNTNPGTIIGGTWVAWGTGRVPVGVDTGQIEFDTVEETGGAKTHTLTVAETPSHNHTQDAHTHTQNAHTHTQNAHNHSITDQVHSHGSVVTAAVGGSGVRTDYTGDAASSAFPQGVTTGGSATGITSTNNATATDQNTTATNQNTTATNQSTGGGGAHNNLQPYITCYFWKRTV